MPTISVIVPVYNVEKYLSRCLDSILNQTFHDFEIILIDDGSTDNSSKLIDIYEKRDSRIRAFHKENGGLSDARNYGLKFVRGKFICFVDSDDWLYKDALNYLLKLINKFNADFSMAKMTRNKSNNFSSKSYEEKLLTQKQFLIKLLKIGTQENVQYACAKLYRKELFKNIRFPDGLTSEDVCTTFKVALNSTRIAYSTKVIYNYFVNNDSITEQTFSRKRLDLIKVWSIVLDTSYKQAKYDWIINAAKVNYYRSVFGVLTNLAMSNLTLKEKSSFLHSHKWLLKKFKHYYPILISAKLPLSRKIMMTCYFINFHFSMLIMHLVTK